MPMLVTVYKAIKVLLFVACGISLRIGFSNLKLAWEKSRQECLTKEEKKRSVYILSMISGMFFLGSFLLFVLGYMVLKAVEGI